MARHRDEVYIEKQSHSNASPWPFEALLSGELCNLPRTRYHCLELPGIPSWLCTLGIAIAPWTLIVSYSFGHCTWQHNNHLHKCLGPGGPSAVYTAVGPSRFSARLWLACSCRSTESGKSLHTWSHFESQEAYFLSPGSLEIRLVLSLLWTDEFRYCISVCNMFCTKKSLAGVPVHGCPGRQPQGWLPATKAPTQSAPWKSRCNCARNWGAILLSWKQQVTWIEPTWSCQAAPWDPVIPVQPVGALDKNMVMAVTTPQQWNHCKAWALLSCPGCHFAAVGSGSLRAPSAVTYDTKQTLQINESCRHPSSAHFSFATPGKTSCAGNPANSGTQRYRCSPQFLESNLVSLILSKNQTKNCETSTTSSQSITVD